MLVKHNREKSDILFELNYSSSLLTFPCGIIGLKSPTRPDTEQVLQ